MMDKIIFLAILNVQIVISSIRVVHGGTTSSLMSLCGETPYPETCYSFISLQPLATLEDTHLGFRESAIRATMSLAQQSHELISSMDLSSFDERAKLAWGDCVAFYGDSVNKLNRSLSRTSFDDTQTWLSSAMTDKETCEDGFIELNQSPHLQSFPSMLSNFSKLLSNSLAINAASMSASYNNNTHHRRLLSDDFPNWISITERKLLQSSSQSSLQADVVVALDGSGNYLTISEAVAAIGNKRSGTKRFVVYVKRGVYKESIEIKASMKNLMFVGDGIDATIISASKNVADGFTTFRSATFGVSGDGFIARDMTFVNTAGPQKGQAVALRSSSDLSIFYRCSFKGYQDTLYVESQRQFYRECNIYGTQDFIFGNANTVLQNCNIYVRKPMSRQSNTITAQSRSDPNENTGIVIQNSLVTASSDLKAVQGSFKSYLGRPWKAYSRTVFIKCYLDNLIDPAGWLPWSGNFALSTLYYGEYMNIGGGAATGGRVKWPGYHVLKSPIEAGKFTVGNFLAGSSWIPASKVPYNAGL